MKTKKETQLVFKKNSVVELTESEASKIVGGTSPGIETLPTRPTSQTTSFIAVNELHK